jgi:hypothetical protein
MGGAYSTNGGDDKCVKILVLERLNGGDHSEDLGVDGKII